MNDPHLPPPNPDAPFLGHIRDPDVDGVLVPRRHAVVDPFEPDPLDIEKVAVVDRPAPPLQQIPADRHPARRHVFTY